MLDHVDLTAVSGRRAKLVSVGRRKQITMISSILILWRNTKEMPEILRMFCQGAMVAPPILAVFVVFPFSDWTVNGRQVPYRELWASGAALTMLVFLLTATAGAWGLAARASWARWAWAAAPVASLLVAVMFPRTWFTEETRSVWLWLNVLGTSVLIYCCMFMIPAVRDYVARSAPTDS
jgi:hypothetical protein